MILEGVRRGAITRDAAKRIVGNLISIGFRISNEVHAKAMAELRAWKCLRLGGGRLGLLA